MMHGVNEGNGGKVRGRSRGGTRLVSGCGIARWVRIG